MKFHSRLLIFTLTILAALAVAGSLAGYLEFFFFTQLEESEVQRCESLLGIIAVSNQRAILTDDRATLTSNLDALMENLSRTGLRYVILQDPDTNVVAEVYDPDWDKVDREAFLKRMRTIMIRVDSGAGELGIEGNRMSDRNRAAVEGETRPVWKELILSDANVPMLEKKSIEWLETDSGLPLIVFSLPIARGRLPIGGIRMGVFNQAPQVREDLRFFLYTSTLLVIIIAGALALFVADLIDRRFNLEANALLEEQKREADEKLKKIESMYMRKEEDNPISPAEFLQLLDFARLAGSSLDYNEALEHGLKALLQLMNVHDASVFVLDPTTNEISGRVGHDESGFVTAEEMAKIRVPVGKGDIGQAAEFGTTTTIDSPKPGSAIVSALVAKGRTIGVVLVKNKINGRPFIKKDQMLIRIFAGLLANSMDNAAIFHHLSSSSHTG